MSDSTQNLANNAEMNISLDDVNDVNAIAEDKEDESGGSSPEDSLDAIFRDVGQFSRYQKLLVFLVLLPCSLPCGLHQFDQVFMGLPVDHKCRVVEGTPLPMLEGNKTNACFEFNFERNSSSCSPQNPDDCSLIKCRDGWDFDPTAPASIVSDFDLVCEKDVYPSIGLCIFQIANGLGMPIFGYVADRFGRKKSFMLGLGIQISATALASLSTNATTFFIARFFVGLTVPACFLVLGIYGLELVGPDYREMFSVLQCSFFTLGMCILSGLAYAFPAWKHIAYTSSSVLVPLLVIMWFAPESPRWNLLNDRLEETYDLFLNILGDSPAKMKMAQVFVKRLEAVQKSELKEYRLETGSGLRESIRKVFQTKQMRNKMLLMTYEWATAQTVYIGLGYYGPGIHENPYLAFFLSSAVEFLCFPVAYWYMHRVGRRPAYALSVTLGGLFAVIAVAMPNDGTGTSAALMAVFLVAKLSIAAAFLITIPYAGELYPTELRAFGFSVGSVLGGLVCSPAPLVVYLGASNLALPLIIFGCLAVAGGILSLLLPETLGKAMPQTVQEADENKLIPFSSAFSPQGIKSLFTVKA